MTFKAEYIWIDGTEPTAKLRSKTKILADGAELPIWGFDGSSTNQAEGHASDRVLKPVFSCPDPIRGGDNVLVLCEVLNTDMTPHESNTRAALAEVAEKFAAQEPIFGIEQEYTFFKGSRPLGFPEGGFPAAQGGYYCGVGADEIFGRDVVEAHLENCLKAGLGISGINAEVMPGQWEFQVGPLAPLEVSDQLWVARWLLYRTAEDFERLRDAGPQAGQGRLERRRRAHQLLHQGDARGLRRDHHRLRVAGRGLQAARPRQELRRGHRRPPDRPARDRPVERVQLRRLRPRRLGPHPVAGRAGRQGLHRGPPPERQRRPVRRDPPDRRHLLHRAGEGRPGLIRRRRRERASAGPAGGRWSVISFSYRPVRCRPRQRTGGRTSTTPPVLCGSTRSSAPPCGRAAAGPDLPGVRTARASGGASPRGAHPRPVGDHRVGYGYVGNGRTVDVHAARLLAGLVRQPSSPLRHPNPAWQADAAQSNGTRADAGSPVERPELTKALAELEPDVAVVDVRLPPSHTDKGLRCALAVRRARPGLPVLVLSQHVEQLYAHELLADGRGGRRSSSKVPGSLRGQGSGVRPGTP